MNVLIIEDDQTKVKDLQEVLEEMSDMQDILVRGSYQSGLRFLSQNSVDVVLLDMTLPLYDEFLAGGGGHKMQFGGELILKEMVAEGITSKVIVISQHDYFADYVYEINLLQLGEKLAEQFNGIVIDTILYDSSEFEESEGNGWKQKLRNALILCRKI